MRGTPDRRSRPPGAATRTLLALAGVAAMVPVLAACGGNASVANAAEVETLDASALPDTLLDLSVEAEDVAMVQEQERPYVDAVGLYSLRRGELLQATLQVSRFHRDADADKGWFRRSVVQQIGSSKPREFRMEDQTVYLTTGRRQSIAVWFKGRHLFVLSTRDDYETPRALLRAALEVEP